MINLCLTVEQATKLLGRDLCAICSQPYSVRDLEPIDDAGEQWACADCVHAIAATERREALPV